MEVEKKVSEFKSLTKVVPRVELLSIYLVNGNIERKSDALEHNKLEAEIAFNSELFSETDNEFTAIVSFSVIGRSSEDKKYEAVKIEGKYLLNYSIDRDSDVKKADLKSFCDMNAIYNAWPYWREFVQSTTVRMAMPALTLPLLKFRPPNKRKKESKKTK